MYFTQKYMHILTYTDIRPPHHSVGICKYVLEIHTHTAQVKTIYCSLEVKYMHILAHTYIYCEVRIRHCMSVYDSYSAVCLQYMNVLLIIYVDIHQNVYACIFQKYIQYTVLQDY